MHIFCGDKIPGPYLWLEHQALMFTPLDWLRQGAHVVPERLVLRGRVREWHAGEGTLRVQGRDSGIRGRLVEGSPARPGGAHPEERSEVHRCATDYITS